MAERNYSDPYGRPTSGSGFGRGNGSSSTSTGNLLGAWLNATRQAGRIGSAVASGGTGVALEVLRRLRDEQNRERLFGGKQSTPVTSSRRPGGGGRERAGSSSGSQPRQRAEYRPDFYGELENARSLIWDADRADNPARNESWRYFNMLRDRVLPRLQPDSYEYGRDDKYSDGAFVERAMRYFADQGLETPIRTFAQNDPETRVQMVDDQNYLRVVPTEGSGVTPGRIDVQIPNGLWLDLVLAERGRLPLSYEQQAYLNMLADPNFVPQQFINEAVREVPLDRLNQSYEIDPPYEGGEDAIAWVEPYKDDPNISFLMNKYYPENPDMQKMIYTVMHEFGHLADYYPRSFWGTLIPFGRSRGSESADSGSPERSRYDEFVAMQNADAEHQRGIELPEVDRWFTLWDPTLGEPAATEYGATREAEDFAERFAMYMIDRREGGIGRTTTGEFIRFADLFPNSAQFIDRFLAERSAALG